MRNSFGAVALVCTLGAPARSAAGSSRPPPGGARSPVGFAPFQRDLPIMPEASPVAVENGVHVFDLDIREGVADILPGMQTPIFGYDGIYPGPTIRARKGQAAIVRARNGLTFDSNIHLHGGYVPAKSDGHPMDVIAPGGTFDSAYPNEQDARAALVPRPRPRPDRAHALLRARRLLRARGRPRGAARPPARGARRADRAGRTTRSTVTGRCATPRTWTSGSSATRSCVGRWRRGWAGARGSTASASSTRPTRASTTCGSGRGRPMVQVGSDGGLLERGRAAPGSTVHLPERIDLLIDFRRFKPGSQGIRALERGGRRAPVDARR